MDPELLQSIADENGLPVQHFDGYSVVDHPSGPMVVAHPPGARVPRTSGGESPPPREGVPSSLARPPEPPASIAVAEPRRAYMDRVASAQVERLMHTPGSTLATRLAAERQRQQRVAQDQAELDAQHAEYVRTHGDVSEPDQFGIVTRTRPDGHTERVGSAEAFAREHEAQRLDELRRTPTSAGTTTFPDGSTVTTDASGRSVMPERAPIDMERLRAELADRPGDRAALSIDEGPTGLYSVARDALAQTPLGQAAGQLFTPSVAEAQTQSAPESTDPYAATAPGPPPPSGPIVTSRRGGGARPGPAPMTLPGALDQLAGTPQARQAFDGTIAGLAQGGPQARREPDLIDRQLLLDQQRAGLATKAAGTQAQIEQQAEQQRQQLEQDRQAAVRGAQQRYQNAIQRVSDAHLDPSRWFRDQGAAGTVTATIAVALGALGQALTGSSTNSALDQINQAIDRDMTAQQSEIDAARAGADLTGNMLSITRQEFSDRQAAADAARAAMLQQAALHVQEMEGSLAGAEAQQNADAMRAQLAQQANEAQAAAEERQSQIDLRHAQTLRELARASQETTRADRMAHGGGAGHPFQASAPMFQTFEAALASGFPREQAALLAGFPAGITPQHSASTTEQRGAIDALSASLGQLESIAGQGDIPGVGLFDSRLPGPEGRTVRDEIANAIDLVGRLRSGGAISDQEAANFSAIIGAGEWQTEDQFRAGLARVRRDLDARLGRTGTQGSAPDREHAAVGFTPG